MSNSLFPETPPPPPRRLEPIEIVVPREPLASIFQGLGISIHQVVNCRFTGGIVRGMYTTLRRLENESWLRRQIEGFEDEDGGRRG